MLAKITKPVQLLYHGTSSEYSVQIEQEGLKPINYNKVYLTADINVAYDYAKNKINSNKMLPVICIVDAQEMYKDGYSFTHEIDNAEYTVDKVPPKYILQVVVETEEDLELLSHYVHEQVD